MRRLGRWVRNGFALVSLVLLAAALALGVQSYRASYMYSYSGYVPAGPEGAPYRTHHLRSLGQLSVYRRAVMLAWRNQEDPVPHMPGSSGWKVTRDEPYDRLQHVVEFYGHAFFQHRWSGPGFELAWNGGWDSEFGNFRVFAFQIDLLWLIGFFSVAPVLTVIRLARERRRRLCARGVCSACGYDLRATPERCPECGRVAAK
jgi:hypothetical protein